MDNTLENGIYTFTGGESSPTDTEGEYKWTLRVYACEDCTSVEHEAERINFDDHRIIYARNHTESNGWSEWILSSSGKRTCRFIVGTSTAGWTLADCDYLCDGTDDQVEINAAIQSLPDSGGTILILDGTYSISNLIDINRDNVTLRGSGLSTKLNFIYVQSTASTMGGIYIRKSSCNIDNLSTDYVSDNIIGDYLAGIRFLEDASNSTITNCNIRNSIVVSTSDQILISNVISVDWYKTKQVTISESTNVIVRGCTLCGMDIV